MNKLQTLFLTVLLACSAQAESPQKKEWRHDFNVGLEGFHYQYSEATPESKHFMHDKGIMYGVNGAYQLTYKDNIFLRPEARLAYGYANYWSEKSGEIKSYSTPSRIIESRLLAGFPLKILERLILSPYSGVGYRNKWSNGSGQKTTTGHDGYKRKNDLWYIPVGFRFKYDFNEQWNLQGMAEYDFLLSGRQYSYGTKNTPFTTANKQTQGKGIKGELLIGRQFEKVAVSGGIYAHYWKVQKSNTIYYHFKRADGWDVYGHSDEPKNVTTEIGLKFNIHI